MKFLFLSSIVLLTCHACIKAQTEPKPNIIYILADDMGINDAGCYGQNFLPTVCDLLGQNPPEKIDGISFLPALMGQSQKEHKLLYWEYWDYNYNWKPGSISERNFILSRAVRMGDWKAVRNNLNKNPEAALELYDLKDDPGEQVNLADKFPEKATELLEIIKRDHKDSEFFSLKSKQ